VGGALHGHGHLGAETRKQRLLGVGGLPGAVVVVLVALVVVRDRRRGDDQE